MRQIKELLRLSCEVGLKVRPIARSLQMSPATVGDYLRRARVAKLPWPLPPELDEVALERLLYPPPKPSGHPRPLPDWAQVHQERKRKGVTLALLWHEYKSTHPDGLQYSQFCEHYRRFTGTLDVVMRQTHRAGEKLFVDYAGQTVPIVDRHTGGLRPAQIFVAALGAGNYTYVEATWTQALPDWIGSHQRALRFFGGVPTLVVPDNLKSGVATPCRYEPEPNATYHEFAAHYGLAILPARVRRPRDKAKVEVGVQCVERWILARLRHQTFFSLAELNAAIGTLLVGLNQRPFKKLPGSRLTLFEQLDRPALRPLPAEAYVFGEWLKARVPSDYHMAIDGHAYSVPHGLVGQRLEVRLTATTVEVFHRGQRIASHPRSRLKGRHTTTTEHMPEAHQQVAQWTPQRLIHWAEHTGPATATVVDRLLTSCRHPQPGTRAALGLLRLGKTYGIDRLEAACQRAHAVQAYSYKSVVSILKHHLDQAPLPAPETAPQEPIAHPNIRGAQYYH